MVYMEPLECFKCGVLMPPENKTSLCPKCVEPAPGASVEELSRAHADRVFDIAPSEMVRRDQQPYWRSVEQAYRHGYEARAAQDAARITTLETQVAMLSADHYIKKVICAYAELDDENKKKINDLMEAILAIRRNK